MAVYKRGAKGVFYMNFTVDGVRVFRSTGKFTKKEAKLVEAVEKKRMMDEGSLSPKVKKARLKLSEAIRQVYDERWKHNKDGLKSYRNAERMMELTGDIPIGSMDEDVIRLLTKTLELKNITSSTINRQISALKTVLRHHKQPWDHIKLKKEPKGRIRVLSDHEACTVVKLLRTINPNDKGSYFHELADLVEVLLDTGMRLSEGLDLKYEDINFSSNLLSIWFNKGEKPRSLPMTKRVRSIFHARKVEGRVKPFTISINQAEYAWRRIRREMGLEEDKEFIIHALRHTCATRLVNNGIDLYVVKEWLGHSCIKITERYAHLNPKKLNEAVYVLEPV
jgi:site-specific recombinase XerD